MLSLHWKSCTLFYRKKNDIRTKASMAYYGNMLCTGIWSNDMANVKQGNKTRSPQWWKHLRDWKRVFWKSERQAQKKDIKNES